MHVHRLIVKTFHLLQPLVDSMRPVCDTTKVQVATPHSIGLPEADETEQSGGVSTKTAPLRAKLLQYTDVSQQIAVGTDFITTGRRGHQRMGYASVQLSHGLSQ